ncbi:cupin domain-containing protein [Kribbella antibiotica]|uniref:Cupin domain-containing protein n=1 Tax=Kribbella antibiotica TaxID=190195 RepID=A0A4R4YTC5_9ACTN|nr:cupin domain-containing protein [Kribbella antibiotica]TDD48561.1 cupin domain-containing protein [Kribbella antibiotica]
MPVVRAADAPKIQAPGLEFTVQAAPSLGSPSVCTWRLRVDPGFQVDAPHTLDADEVFVVLSGAVQITPDGEKLTAGDSLIVPAGEPIGITNLGEGHAEIQVVITSGFTGTMADGSTVQPPWSR